jgi:pyridoxal phosphate enzyme (YggS family)
MHNSVDKLNLIKKEILAIPHNNTHIIAVSKTFPMIDILPIINCGHIHFGENKIQEAMEKWIDIKNDFGHIKLHMIGRLQSNKVKFVVPLFDYIHSLDNLKLAEKISTEEIKFKKKIQIFIQINIGNESQKNGINISDLDVFYKRCVNDFNLNIIGLMCLPPKDSISLNYFSDMKNLAQKINVKELSMGMSADYLDAATSGATFLRIGSRIFGSRD